MAQTAESFLQSERERYQKQREDLEAKRAEIDQQIEQIDRELYALDVYVQAKAGKFRAPTATQSERRPRASSGPRAPRGARGELREKIIALLKQHPEGLVAKQITSVVTDKAVPNLLSLMKKEGAISQEARHRPYFIAEEQA